MDYIKKSNFILCHQRLATHGLDNRYIQPFKNNDFVLLHNGILSSFAKGNYSDTWGFFKKFNNLFTKTENKSRDKKIVFCIKKLLDKISGSFSIVLFDKKEKVLYYFKNDMTSINLYRSKDKKEVYITTSITNKEILDLYGDFSEMKFYDDKIYKIYIKNKKVFYKVIGDIQESVGFYPQNNYPSNTRVYNNADYEFPTEEEKGTLYISPTEKKEVGVLSSDMASDVLGKLKKGGFIPKRLKKCWYCNTPTDIYHIGENRYLCYDCIENSYL